MATRLKMKHQRNPKSIPLLSLIGKARLITCLIISVTLFWLSKAILDKKTFEFDSSFVQRMHEINEPVLTIILHPFYTIGDTQSAAIIVVLSLGILTWRRYWKEAQILAFASLGVLLLVDKVLKPFFLRPRPSHRLDETVAGFSFPSGHATGNLVLYLFLAYILAARYPKFTIHIYAATIVFLILMGLSSIYLRVHWPTDILAGYGYGYLWLTLCLILLKLIAKKYR